MNAAIRVEATGMERDILHDLVSQLIELLGEDDAGDPARARLSPDAYPDDPDASREFRRLTSADSTSRRTLDARTVLHALEFAEPGGDLDITLDRAQFGSWIRTISALRLILADRLDITADDDHDPDEPRYGLYYWLAYRLETLIEAAG